MSEWTDWDRELVQQEDSAGLQDYGEALTTEAEITGQTGFADAAWKADAATEFESGAEDWASYSADASADASHSLEDAAAAYAAGDTAGGDYELRQAELSTARSDWAGGVAETADATADTYAVQSYDTAVDTSWDAAATAETPIDTTSCDTSTSYDTTSYETTTSYDTTVDDSAY